MNTYSAKTILRSPKKVGDGKSHIVVVSNIIIPAGMQAISLEFAQRSREVNFRNDCRSQLGVEAAILVTLLAYVCYVPFLLRSLPGSNTAFAR